MMAQILVVDDDESTARILKYIFERAGYQVEWAATAGQGLTLALAAEPLLMIIDLHLPEVDGFTLIKQLKSYPHLQNIPITVLTSDVSCEAQQRASALQCDLFLGKPFACHDLCEHIEQLINS